MPIQNLWVYPPRGRERGLRNILNRGKSIALDNRLQQELEFCAIRNTSWYDN